MSDNNYSIECFFLAPTSLSHKKMCCCDVNTVLLSPIILSTCVCVSRVCRTLSDHQMKLLGLVTQTFQTFQPLFRKITTISINQTLSLKFYHSLIFLLYVSLSFISGFFFMFSADTRIMEKTFTVFLLSIFFLLAF